MDPLRQIVSAFKQILWEASSLDRRMTKKSCLCLSIFWLSFGLMLKELCFFFPLFLVLWIFVFSLPGKNFVFLSLRTSDDLWFFLALRKGLSLFWWGFWSKGSYICLRVKFLCQNSPPKAFGKWQSKQSKGQIRMNVRQCNVMSACIKHHVHVRRKMGTPPSHLSKYRIKQHARQSRYQSEGSFSVAKMLALRQLVPSRESLKFENRAPAAHQPHPGRTWAVDSRRNLAGL